MNEAVMPESIEIRAAISRLAQFVGEKEALEVFSTCLGDLAIEQVSTPDDLLRLAECLMRLGDVSSLIGRILKARALEMAHLQRR